MSKAHVTDRDHGYKAMRERIARAARGAHVVVGLLGEDASKVHETEEGERASGITIGELGEIFEFGLGQPIRSWLRGFVDEERTTIEAKIRRMGKAVKAGQLTPEAALDLLGFSLVGGIKQRIANGIAPPVSEATQRRKGPNKTTALINSGQFRGSISHRVLAGSGEA